MVVAVQGALSRGVKPQYPDLQQFFVLVLVQGAVSPEVENRGFPKTAYRGGYGSRQLGFREASAEGMSNALDGRGIPNATHSGLREMPI